jgi:TonB family protein
MLPPVTAEEFSSTALPHGELPNFLSAVIEESSVRQTYGLRSAILSLLVHIAGIGGAAYYGECLQDRPAELLARSGDGAYRQQGVAVRFENESVLAPTLSTVDPAAQPTPVHRQPTAVETQREQSSVLTVASAVAEIQLQPLARVETDEPKVETTPQQPVRAAASADRAISSVRPRAGAEQSARGGVEGKVRPDFSGNREPIYPPTAVAERIEGTVLLRLTVAVDGRVREVTVAKSSGSKLLDDAAVEAVSQWRGSPATVAGRRVETMEVLPVRFELSRARMHSASFR